MTPPSDPGRSPHETSLVDLLGEAGAPRTPSTALVGRSDDGGVVRLGYAELSDLVARRAAGLRDRGIDRGARVGLVAARQVDVVVTMLALLRIGAAYVPLDPRWPDARWRQIADASDMSLVVGPSELLDGRAVATAAAPWTDLAGNPTADDPPGPLDPSTEAYVMFTSGSTGMPKGVAVSHGNLAARVASYRTWHPVPPVSLCQTSVAFDAALPPLVAVLAAGGTVVLGSDAEADDPAAAARVIAREGVTYVDGVPSWYATLLDVAEPGELTSLRLVVVGAEALPPELVATHHRVLPQARLINDYGPTEATIGATWFEVPPAWSGSRVPIGRPHLDTSVYVVDGDGELVSAATTGELWIGGAGVAQGYVARPDDPAFGPNPFGEGRIYRSGDLARWNADGELELIGRADRQVKIRGQRVEPDETELVLLGPGFDDVAQAAVEIDRTTGTARLVAYVTARGDAALDADDVAARLADLLPPAQRPDAVVVLPTMPLTVGGKVDRPALAANAPVTAPPRRELDAEPLDAREMVIAAAIEEVLQHDGIGRDTDFFSLGGDSLSAARVVARVRRALDVDLAPHDLREAPTVADLAALAATRPARSGAIPPPTPVARGDDGSVVARASHAQESFWYMEQLPGRTATNNLIEVVSIPGADLDHARAALVRLVDRHTGLRTGFEVRDEHVAQVVHPTTTVRIDVEPLDLSADADEAVAAFGRRPFDLAAPPLLRLGWSRDADRLDLVVVIHHAIADGWALDLLVGELIALTVDPTTELAPVALDAVDATAWLDERIEREGAAAAATWRRHIELGVETAGELLPYDRGPHVTRVPGGTVTRLRVPPDTTRRLTTLADAANASLFSVLVSALAILLRRGGAPDRFAIGAAIANRTMPELEGIIASITNSVPLTVEVDGGRTVAELVRSVDEEVRLADSWSWYPGELELRDRRASTGELTVDVLVSMLNLGLDAGDPEGVRRRSVPSQIGLTDLGIEITPRGGGLDVVIDARTDRLDPASIRRLARRLQELLEALDVGGGQPVHDLLEPSPQDLDELRVLTGEAGPAPTGTVMDHIAAHLGAPPARAAVITPDRTIAWDELRTRVRRLAAGLAARGTTPGDRVVLAVDGSDAIEALVACWWLGAVAVPLGERQPPAKVDAVAARTAAAITIRPGDLVELADETPADASVPRQPVAPTDVAYILFTSGSTGAPKGVVVSHGALRASTDARLSLYVDAPAVTFLAHDTAFDAALGIIAWYLAIGGSIVTAPYEHRLDPVATASLIRRHEVGQIDAVPSHLQMLLEHAAPDTLGSLRLLTTGAETCPPSLVELQRALLPDARLVNEYGPTECTVWTVAHECVADDVERESVPIGRPIAGTIVRIADLGGRVLPRGSEGELLLGGHLLADGYLDDPEQTADRFIDADGTRWYRTGDRARWNNDGELDFLGRFDQQLKLRGYRIEPGEVEATLQAHPSVLHAAVGLVELVDGVPSLVAWYRHRPDHHVDAGELLARCREHLPPWMVPAAFVPVAAMPLTTSGKLDRARLPTPVAASIATAVPPATPTERSVVEVCTDLIGHPIGATDDFFEAGGNSLLAVRLVARLSERLGTTIALTDLLEEPTPRHLAAVADRQLRGDLRTGPGDPTLIPVRPDGTRSPLVVVVRDVETSLYIRHFADGLDPDRPVWILMRPPPLVGAADFEAEARLFRAELGATFGDRPVILAGHSVAGIIAAETARRAGDAVEAVVVFDSLAPVTRRDLLREAASRLLAWSRHPVASLGRWYRRAIASPAAEVRDDRADEGADDDGGARRDADTIGLERYRAGRYDHDLILLVASDTTEDMGDDLGWRRFAASIEVHTLAGDHISILTSPQVDTTVAVLDEVLRGRP